MARHLDQLAGLVLPDLVLGEHREVLQPEVIRAIMLPGGPYLPHGLR